MKKGFTLIEVIIYIALFSLLMGSAFITAYQLIDGSGKIGLKNTVQNEGNFVMRKFNWALTGIDQAIPPVVTGTSCDKKLTINKFNFTPNPIVIKRDAVDNSIIDIKEGGGSFLPLTTANVKVSCLNFIIIPPSGSGPSGITATATINGIDFTITKYIRK